ncbi:MAG: HAD family hydrolase [candidate division WOR-3 bacterium]
MLSPLMIKAIIFDLDGTLYKSKKIERKFAEAAYYTLAKFKKIGLREASRLVEDRRARLSQKKGHRIPYTYTLRSFGVPIEYWHRENIRYFDPRDYLRKSIKLKKIFKQLHKNYRLAVVTNNNRVQTMRILKALNIEKYFTVIQTFNDSNRLKPDPKVFVEVTRRLKVDPKECLSVGDRVDVDLLPAQKIGMAVLKVNSPRGISRLLKLLPG